MTFCIWHLAHRWSPIRSRQTCGSVDDCRSHPSTPREAAKRQVQNGFVWCAASTSPSTLCAWGRLKNSSCACPDETLVEGKVGKNGAVSLVDRKKNGRVFFKLLKCVKYGSLGRGAVKFEGHLNCRPILVYISRYFAWYIEYACGFERCTTLELIICQTLHTFERQKPNEYIKPCLSNF